MFFHFVKKNESIDYILNEYGMTLDEFKLLNTNIDYKKLEQGMKIIVKNKVINNKPLEEKDIYDDEKFAKYICPHCKNIILIPK